jgi:quercetin dioxygenase-like cupin family protein
MHLTAIPFSTTDWSEIEAVEYPGETGVAIWKTMYVNNVRIRLVKYSAGYEADHWCSKGHIIYCVEGEMITELQDGRKMPLRTGMMYTVGDNCEAHKSTSVEGCTLFIVD